MECRNNPELWFSDDLADMDRAKALCEECPMSVYKKCRGEGWNHEFGVFGGLSHVDRSQIDPDRYRALEERNRKLSEAKDEEILRMRRISCLTSGLSLEQAQQVKATVATESRQVAGVALVGMGFPVERVAEFYGVARDTVYQWVSRARKRAAAAVA